MGRGGAQLGKAVKGKSKERKKDKAVVGKAKENASEKQLSEDIRMLEEYEKMNKMAEAQRTRLKVQQHTRDSNNRVNEHTLWRLLIVLHCALLFARSLVRLHCVC